MYIRWPTTTMPNPSFVSERVFSRSMVVIWRSVLMWLVARWGPKFCGWLWDDASCEMSSHVIWCVLVLCDAMLRNALRYHVMSSHVMSCHICWEVTRGNGMRSYEFVTRCGGLRCHLVWFEIAVWGDLENDLVIGTTQIYSVLVSTTMYYSVLHSITLYHKVLVQYFSVLQRTSTTKYKSSIIL